MAEKTTMITVFTESDLGFYSGALGMEDEQVKNIQIIAKGLTGDITLEQRDEALSLATALKRTPRVTVYELSKGDNGRTDVVTTDHFVGKKNPGGRTFSVGDSNNETFNLALEDNKVIHNTPDELLDAVGTQHLGINNFAEQVDTCALTAFEKAFADLSQQ